MDRHLRDDSGHWLRVSDLIDNLSKMKDQDMMIQDQRSTSHSNPDSCRVSEFIDSLSKMKDQDEWIPVNEIWLQIDSTTTRGWYELDAVFYTSVRTLLP